MSRTKLLSEGLGRETKPSEGHLAMQGFVWFSNLKQKGIKKKERKLKETKLSSVVVL